MENTNFNRIDRLIFSKTCNLIPDKIKNSSISLDVYKKIFGKQRKRIKNFKEQLKKLEIIQDFEIIEHHYAHACTALYKNQWNFKDCLVFTNDGSGDGLSGTISIYKDGTLERFKEISSYNSIGEFYSRITTYLGMKALEHEYKVMGLAPYVMETEYYTNIKNKFSQFFKIDGLDIINKTRCWGDGYIPFFKKYIYPIRFDYVAKATQDLIETVVVEWVRNAITKTGIHNVCLAGGLFMNVKLNMKIRNLEEVEKLFVFPSGGDESIAIGAALALNSITNKNAFSPLINLYFGQHYENDKIENELKKDQYHGKIKFEYVDNIEDRLLEELLNKKIVARFSGRMEWGARALGNRSILAIANDSMLLHKINKAIKKRDFWMPFAPSILYDEKDKYIIDNNKMVSYYMNMAYDTKEKAKEDIIAAIHPFDFSARPQLVTKEFNEKYYKIIQKLNNETGIGGILNTSFNLHGQPIVNSPKDALDTLLNSDIDYLVMENYLVNRNI
jgi:carbamoyltransferase